VILDLKESEGPKGDSGQDGKDFDISDLVFEITLIKLMRFAGKENIL